MTYILIIYPNQTELKTYLYVLHLINFNVNEYPITSKVLCTIQVYTHDQYNDEWLKK